MYEHWRWLATEAQRKIERYHAEAKISGLLAPKSLRRRLAEGLLKLAARVDLETVQALIRPAASTKAKTL